jgi:PAS domain S-box-containing protein
VRSILAAPLLQGNVPLGVLSVLAPFPNTFTDLDGYTLQLLAGMTAAALVQARTFEALQASEGRYRLLFEQNVAGVFRSTRDGRILDCNDALVQYLGYASREELLAQPSWDLYQQRSDREALVARLERERSMTNVRVHLKRKDGSPVIGLVNISIIPAEQGEPQLLGTMVEA